MKLGDAWRLSRIPYREVVYKSIAEERGRMWWGAFGRRHLDKGSKNESELTKMALRVAKFDKIIVAVFAVITAVIPFASRFHGSPLLGLTSSISLSLAVTFGFTMLYAIQTLSSFVSAESSALLSTLPLAEKDFSWITWFSFVRSVDYLVVGSILSQVALVGVLSASLSSTILMFVAALMNAVFAVTIALWFSRTFYKTFFHGGRSRGRTVLRLVLIFVWGSLLLGVGIMLSVPWYVVPTLERALFGLDPIAHLFVSLLPPFSAGIAIAHLISPTMAFSTVLSAFVAMIGYVILSGVAVKWSLGTVQRISKGVGIKLARATTNDFSFKARSPLLGYVLKDLRVASRHPATAFFFALPVLETVFVTFMIANFEVLRASTILVSTFLGGVFALLMPLALLNAEGGGLEYTKTLPVPANKIILSKTLISTATYVPIPLALLCLALLKPLTSSLTILIPYFTILAIASASIFEIKLFLGSVAEGRIAALVQDLKKLVVGIMTILIPAVAYASAYLLSFNHINAISMMGVVTIAELAMAIHVLKRS